MVRKFERTHPWVRFRVDLTDLPHPVWMLLGEARSKCEHLAGTPLRPDIAARLSRVTLARGVAATTAIEGNTLSPEDVEKHIEGTLEVPQSKAYQVQEVDNILEALNDVLLKDIAEGALAPLCSDRIKKFNAIVLKDLPNLEEGVLPGELRQHSVVVGRYRAAPAEDCPYLLDQLCTWLNGSDFERLANQEEYRVPIALIRAILAHLYLAWIHPFGDGNGRTARLVETETLAAAGVPHIACHLLSNHYNETRAEYYAQLDRASKSGGEVLPFLEYAIRGFIEGLTSNLEHVRAQQLDVTWINYVHERFKTRKTPSGNRVRELVLELSKRSKPVSRRALAGMAPELARAYAGTTDRTLSRDIKVLEEMGLIRRTAEGYKAQRELILAFLPLRHRATKRPPVAESNIVSPVSVPPTAESGEP